MQFEMSHDSVGGSRNEYTYVAPVFAYRYEGVSAQVESVQGSVVVNDGDWMCQWPNGEIGVINNDDFREQYNVDKESLRAHHTKTRTHDLVWRGWPYDAECECGYRVDALTYAH